MLVTDEATVRLVLRLARREPAGLRTSQPKDVSRAVPAA
jgi:hypothetical protein